MPKTKDTMELLQEAYKSFIFIAPAAQVAKRKRKIGKTFF